MADPIPAGFIPDGFVADEVSYHPDPTMQAETARAIGRSQGLGFGASRPPVVDELGRPANGSTEPDTYLGGFLKSLKDQALNATVNNPALQAAARPQSASDLTALLLPNAPGAMSGAWQGAKDTANSLGRLRVHPSALLDLRLNQPLSMFRKAVSIAPGESIAQPLAADLGPGAKVLQGPDQYREPYSVPYVRSGSASPRVVGMLRTSASPAVSDQELIAQKLAELQARGRQISTSTPAALTPEQAAAQATVHSGAVLETPVPAVNGPQGVPVAAIGPDASVRAATMNGAAPHPLEQPRDDVGAEVVGRQNGLTKQQVRDLTQSPLAETPGGASSIVPEQTLDKFFKKMRGMSPEGTERFDYVNAAKDPKTRAQLENLRRTLKLAGLSAAGAVGSRQALVNMMQQDQ